MKRLAVTIGLCVGICFGAWTFFQNPRPAVCNFLQAPVIAFFEILDRNSRPPGLGGLAIIIPVWFIYWGFLGAATGFLAQCLFSLLRKLRRRDYTQRKQ